VNEPSRTAATAAGRPARMESIVQVLIMLAIGLAAGAASFTHVHDVAASHGQGGWLAGADAVVLELMSVSCGLEIRRRSRVGKSVLFPGSVLVLAVALSISAQIVEAEQSVIGWIAAALPALGFLVMVKIALGRTPSPTAVPGKVRARVDVADVARPDDVRVAFAHDAMSGVASEAAPTPAELAELLPTARAARDDLLSHGRPLTRDTLAAQLRAGGYPMRNFRVSMLLHALREDAGRPGTCNARRSAQSFRRAGLCAAGPAASLK
jgi:hypothetical protein